MTMRSWILLLFWLTVPVSPGLADDATQQQPPPPVDARTLTERILDDQRARRAPAMVGTMAGVEADRVFERYEKMLGPEPKDPSQ